MTKALFFISLLLLAWVEGITKISRTNELKRIAHAAYAGKKYQQAADALSQIIQESKDPDPATRLNVAHAYRQLGQKVKAAREYQQVVRQAPAELKSIALQQLGNLLAQEGEYEPALDTYKEALKANPKNADARYNYELLRRYLDNKNPEEEPESDSEEEKKPEQPKQQNQEQQQSNQQSEGGGQLGQGEQQPAPSGDEEGEQKGQNNTTPPPVDSEATSGKQGVGNSPGEETTRGKLAQIRMSEEKARQLLEAMRQAEQQYLQQVPRRQTARSRNGKPDW